MEPQRQLAWHWPWVWGRCRRLRLPLSQTGRKARRRQVPGSARQDSALQTSAQRASARLSPGILASLPGEFEAAGQLGKRAAEAAASLSSLPGYVGISLTEGRIVVEGSGAALQARVDELNQAGPADFVLRPVATPAEPLTPAAPSASGPSSAAAPDASPAPSAEATIAPAPGRSARDIDQLFQEYVRDVGTAGLQAVVFTDGHFVIRTGAHSTPESGVPGIPDAPQPTTPEATVTAPGTVSPAEFAARYSNVQLETGASLKTEESYFGGQGYFADNLAICSAGFSAFGPTGLPLVLTAGHCTEDGLAKAADLEPATSSPAGGWKNPLVRPLAPLGKFGFSQFGGVDNSVATSDPATVGTDIAVVEKIRQDLSLEPSALRWDDAENPDPTSVKVIGSVAPVQGQPVCRSGRTTGWKCGTVDSVGIWLMPGRNSLPPLYDNDLRAVRAFDSLSVKSSGGDSGGPWISGNYAVGTHIGSETSSGVQTRALAATFEDSVREIPGGVELELFLNKPAVTSPAPGERSAPARPSPARCPPPRRRRWRKVPRSGSPWKARHPLRFPLTTPAPGLLRRLRSAGPCVSQPKRSTASAHPAPPRSFSPPRLQRPQARKPRSQERRLLPPRRQRQPRLPFRPPTVRCPRRVTPPSSSVPGLKTCPKPGLPGCCWPADWPPWHSSAAAYCWRWPGVGSGQRHTTVDLSLLGALPPV